MLIKKAADILSSEITPKNLYLNRRKFLAGAALASAATVAAGVGLHKMASPFVAQANTKIDGLQKSPFSTSAAAVVAATRGPCRSTQGPPNAALRPSSTRAVVKVVYGGLNHQGDVGNNALIGRLNVLHAYTEPMHRCMTTAATGIIQRLVTEIVAAPSNPVASEVAIRTPFLCVCVDCG